MSEHDSRRLDRIEGTLSELNSSVSDMKVQLGVIYERVDHIRLGIAAKVSIVSAMIAAATAVLVAILA